MAQTPHDREQLHQRILDRGWTEADLREAAQILKCIERDEASAAALRDYDRLRQALETPVQLAEPSRGWDAFENQLAKRPCVKASSRRWVRPSLALAASVALLVVGWWSARLVEVSDRIDRSVAGQVVHSYLPADVDQQVGAFTQVSQVFDNRAGWVAFANGDSQLGLTDRPRVDGQRLLLLRLTMSHRGGVISQTDLAILPGHSAKLTLPFHGDNNLEYHIEVTDDHPTGLMLLAELHRPDGSDQALAAMATNLQLHAGTVVPAGQLVTNSGEYELKLGFQEANWRR